MTLNLNAINFILVDSFPDAVNGGLTPIRISDADNDGLKELIFSSSIYIYKICFYERDPNNGFSLVHILPLYPSNEWTFTDVAISDFDNDGKTDVFATRYSDSTLYGIFSSSGKQK